jgi:hypothetical protein
MTARPQDQKSHAFAWPFDIVKPRFSNFFYLSNFCDSSFVFHFKFETHFENILDTIMKKPSIFDM